MLVFWQKISSYYHENFTENEKSPNQENPKY